MTDVRIIKIHDVGPQGSSGSPGTDGATGATGATGSSGTPGTDGTSLLATTVGGSPASTVGANGDTYLDTLNGDIYVKSNSTWDLAASFGISNAFGLSQTGSTAYTLQNTDAGKLVEFFSTADGVCVIPPSSSVTFTVGTHIDFCQLGSSGSMRMTTGSGVTIGSRVGTISRGQYARWHAYKSTTNTWVLGGDLSTST